MDPRLRGDDGSWGHTPDARGVAYAAFLAASCRSTYCRMPPCRKYSTSFGVSSSTLTSKRFSLPSVLRAVTVAVFASAVVAGRSMSNVS